MDQFSYDYQFQEQKPRKKKRNFWKGLLITLGTVFAVSVVASTATIGYYIHLKLGKKITKISESKQILKSQLNSAESYLNSFDEKSKNNSEMKSYIELLKNEIQQTKNFLNDRFGFNEEYYKVAANSIKRLVNSINTSWELLKISKNKLKEEVISNTYNQRLLTEYQQDQNISPEQLTNIQKMFKKYQQIAYSNDRSRQEYEQDLINFKYEIIKYSNLINAAKFNQSPYDRLVAAINEADYLLRDINTEIEWVKTSLDLVNFNYIGQSIENIQNQKEKLESLFKDNNPQTGKFSQLNKKTGSLIQHADLVDLEILKEKNQMKNFFEIAKRIAANISNIKNNLKILQNLNVSDFEEISKKIKINDDILREFVDKNISLKSLFTLLKKTEEYKNLIDSRIYIKNNYDDNFHEFKKDFLSRDLALDQLPEIVNNILYQGNDKKIIDELLTKRKELRDKVEAQSGGESLYNMHTLYAEYKNLISNASVQKIEKDQSYKNCLEMSQFIKNNLQSNFQSKVSPDIYKVFYEKLEDIDSDLTDNYAYPKNTNVPVENYQKYYDKAYEEYNKLISQREKINNDISEIFNDLTYSFVDSENKPLDKENTLASNITANNIKFNLPSGSNYKTEVELLPNDLDGTLLINVKFLMRDPKDPSKYVSLLKKELSLISSNFKAQKNIKFKQAIFKPKNDGIMTDLLFYSKYLDIKDKKDVQKNILDYIEPIMDIQSYKQKIKFIDISFLKSDENKLQLIYQFVQTVKTIEYRDDKPFPIAKEYVLEIYTEVVDFKQQIEENTYNDNGDTIKLQILTIINSAIEYKNEKMNKPISAELKNELEQAIQKLREEVRKPYGETTIEKLKNLYKEFNENIYKNIKEKNEKLI